MVIVKIDEKKWLAMFSENLKNLMEREGYSQIGLSRKADIPEYMVNALINQKRKPSVKTVINLAYALNVDVRDLIDFGSPIE